MKKPMQYGPLWTPAKVKAYKKKVKMKRPMQPAEFFVGPTDYTAKELKASENKVEKDSCATARAHGWFTRKYKSPAQNGVQDRLFVKDGKVIFIEYKRVGKVPTGLQCDDAEALRAHGGKVYWTDTVRGTKQILGIPL